MKEEAIIKILDSQRNYFASGETLPLKKRIEALKKLREVIIQNEEKILEALNKDLGKSNTEAYMCEVGLVLSEISYLLKHIKKFSKDKRVLTPLAQFASKSYIKKAPYGNVLIISPWNYPFLLSMEPLVDALAAGNTAIIKPSAYSPESSKIVKDIITSTFAEEYVAVVTGGREENKSLLNQKFDYIFFTGSKNVAKEVLNKAASNITPATLELGGKSPCIVDETANISLTARRIVFGKFINVGQTCVAPDYILCHESVKERLQEALIKEIEKQYAANTLENANYGKIINEKHFTRLLGLIQKEKVIYGGKSNSDTLQIEPTIMDNVTYQDKVMQEEIFGPILPIITYEKFEDIIRQINSQDSPLALYIFSKNKKHIKMVRERCQYGGGCVNDVIVHLATSRLPFGGVGASGMGSYHGKYGFDTFTHFKSILDKKNFIDLPMRYQPYKDSAKKLIRMFLK